MTVESNFCLFRGRLWRPLTGDDCWSHDKCHASFNLVFLKSEVFSSVMNTQSYQLYWIAMESEGNIPSEPSLLYLNLYATFEEVLKIELPQCRNIAFTLEEWTSRAGHGYLSLTIHYINGEFEMRKFTVGCRRTEGKKDDVGLAFNLRSMITSIPGDNACELNYILTLRTKFYRGRKSGTP